MSALFGGRKKGTPTDAHQRMADKISGKAPPPPKPLVEPILVAPALPQIEGVSMEETLRRAEGRKKAKSGRSGTLLSGPRGIETSPAPQRKTLLGY